MSSELKVDTISEKTTASGVTIDGVLIKDGEVDGVDVSAITQGITMSDTWVLTATFSGTNGDITSNLSQISFTAGAGFIGTGLSESSGIFTFPTTGIYMINLEVRFQAVGGDSNDPELKLTFTNDNFSSESTPLVIKGAVTNGEQSHHSSMCVVDVTETTNTKFKLTTANIDAHTNLLSSSSQMRTGFTVMRIGDT